MGANEVEMAHTEVVFREVNERISETAQRFASPEATFVCECADPDCTARIDVSLTEYERVREDGTHFLLCEGHEVPTIERVVRRRLGYAVVEKFQATVAAIAQRANPRRPHRPEIEPA
jgi:hypothetical protein